MRIWTPSASRDDERLAAVGSLQSYVQHLYGAHVVDDGAS